MVGMSFARDLPLFALLIMPSSAAATLDCSSRQNLGPANSARSRFTSHRRRVC